MGSTPFQGGCSPHGMQQLFVSVMCHTVKFSAFDGLLGWGRSRMLLFGPFALLHLCTRSCGYRATSTSDVGYIKSLSTPLRYCMDTIMACMALDCLPSWQSVLIRACVACHRCYNPSEHACTHLVDLHIMQWYCGQPACQ